MDKKLNFEYKQYSSENNNDTKKQKVCCYFVVSDLCKITDADIRFKTEEIIEEITKHDEWVLESVIWDATHKIDTDREGLNTILAKAQKDEFDVLLLHHVSVISRNGGKTFDYALKLYQMGKNVYGIVDRIHTFQDLASKLNLTITRKKKYETLIKGEGENTEN